MTDAATVGEAEQIRTAVLGLPAVAALSAGPFGEVVSHLPGRTVPGVRSDDDAVEVHVVAVYGEPLDALGQQAASALGPVLRGRRLEVTVEDIVLPGEPVPDAETPPMIEAAPASEVPSGPPASDAAPGS